MLEKFSLLSPALQALLATLFTWGMTALGASLVFFFKKTFSWLPWTPISVTSEVSVQGSDSTMSTPVNNKLLNMVRSASYLQLSDCWT